MRRLTTLSIGLLLASGLGTLALAQIKSFTLEEMVQTADQAVYGQITSSHVERVVGADGTEHFYTTLTLQGTLMPDAQPVTVDVTFRGGFISDTEGVFNSEAPAADDVKVGNNVVAFYRWTDDMGGGKAANALVAAHGGIYRTVQTANGPAVLGRGQGYAISSNRYVEQLSGSIRVIAATKPQKR